MPFLKAPLLSYFNLYRYTTAAGCTGVYEYTSPGEEPRTGGKSAKGGGKATLPPPQHDASNAGKWASQGDLPAPVPAVGASPAVAAAMVGLLHHSRDCMEHTGCPGCHQLNAF